MWFNNKYNAPGVNKPTKTTEQIIASLTSDIERLTLEKKEAWDGIKDMTVSANKADQEYKRIVRLDREINKLTKQRKKLSS